MAELSAAQRGKIRRLSQPKELSPDEEGGELNIVPFLDIIVNILIFVLATVAVTFTSTIETTPPSSGGGVRASSTDEALNLTVFIVNEGFSLKVSTGSVASGCSGVGGGITVSKRAGRYDYEALNACAAKLKKSNPAFEEEEQVRILANPNIDYQTVINTVDALQKTPDGKASLFPKVNFAVPRSN